MECSGAVKSAQPTCVCNGTTVFEGAVIGQVFTGEVRMHCPHVEYLNDARAPGRPVPPKLVALALVALAAWQAGLALLVLTPPSCSSISQSVLLLLGATLHRQWDQWFRRFLLRSAGSAARLKGRPCRLW